jgi:hypothetical protein
VGGVAGSQAQDAAALLESSVEQVEAAAAVEAETLRREYASQIDKLEGMLTAEADRHAVAEGRSSEDMHLLKSAHEDEITRICEACVFFWNLHWPSLAGALAPIIHPQNPRTHHPPSEPTHPSSTLRTHAPHPLVAHARASSATAITITPRLAALTT